MTSFLFQATVSFEISKFLDQSEIWLRGRILSADFKSEMIFYIRSQYQADIGHFLQFCLPKSDRHSLTIGLLWQQFKSQMNKTYCCVMQERSHHVSFLLLFFLGAEISICFLSHVIFLLFNTCVM